MNNSGEVAEQMVRMGLDGVEVAAKISGAAAKEIAVLLAAALKNNESNLKLRGRERLTAMLKSGKPLEVFSIKASDLKQFAAGAKEYGIVYCALGNNARVADGIVDILVKADDAPRIGRLIERFHFATVENMAGIETTAQSQSPQIINQGGERGNPGLARAEIPRLSEPISDSGSKSARGISSRRSVKEELREIKAAQIRDRNPALTRAGDFPDININKRKKAKERF